MTNRSHTLDGRVFLLLLLCGSTGCGGEGAFDAWCNTPGREMSILFYALGTGVVAVAVVLWARKRRLDGWNLRESARAPSPWTIVWVSLGAFLLAGLAFSLFLTGAEGCAPEQRTANLWFTWQGVLVATVLCLLGLLGANRWYKRGAER